MEEDIHFLRMAIELARDGMNNNSGGPFGAVIVKNGQIVGKGCNRVSSTNDPTAHAEIVAIRDACQNLNAFQLGECIIYSSCEPCPMCLGAIYWARPKKLVYACIKTDAAAVGFDDQFIYEELAKPINERQIQTENLIREEGFEVMKLWLLKKDKTSY